MNTLFRSIFALIALLLPAISIANPPILLPAWQSDSLLEQPESVVYDPKRQWLYVSNINGQPSEADANGYIALLASDGRIINQHWLTGLNAPKGMAISDDILYVADINQLIAIDLEQQKIIQRYSAPEAKFLNDVAANDNGEIYVSGFLTNSIYRLSNGQFERWLQAEQLASPNGLLVENDQLIVASWGKMTDGFATAIPGHLKAINLTNKQIASLGDTTPVGNLDGIEPDGNGHYLVTDWIAGKLLHISPSGNSTTLLTLDQGSADHTIIPGQDLVIIPMMNSGYVSAYKLVHQ